MVKYCLMIFALIFSMITKAQQLHPGFDILEYQEMLRINAHIYGIDANGRSPIPAPGSAQ